MKLGDSRSLEGTIVPAQDHRPGIDVDLRASEICVRIMDRDDEGRDRDEPELRGNRRGISVWEGQDDRIPCPQWREVRICAVVGPDGYTGSGLGDGTDEPGAAWTPSEGGGGGGANLVSTGVPAQSGYTGASQSVLPPNWWSGQPVNGQSNPLAIKQSSLYNGYSV